MLSKVTIHERNHHVTMSTVLILFVYAMMTSSSLGTDETGVKEQRAGNAAMMPSVTGEPGDTGRRPRSASVDAKRGRRMGHERILARSMSASEFKGQYCRCQSNCCQNLVKSGCHYIVL